jgi:hypothetical protein
METEGRATVKIWTQISLIATDFQKIWTRIFRISLFFLCNPLRPLRLKTSLPLPLRFFALFAVNLPIFAVDFSTWRLSGKLNCGKWLNQEHSKEI